MSGTFKMYDTIRLSRHEKETLFGIEDPRVATARRLANARRDLELRQDDENAERNGYCLCGYALTRLGKCSMYSKKHTTGCINPDLPDEFFLKLRY